MGVERTFSIRMTRLRARIRLQAVIAHEALEQVLVLDAMKELLEIPSFFGLLGGGRTELVRRLAIIARSVEADVVDHRVARVDAEGTRRVVLEDPVDAPDVGLVFEIFFRFAERGDVAGDVGRHEASLVEPPEDAPEIG